LESETHTTTAAFARAAALVPSCALDAAGLARQQERHRRLAPDVVSMQRVGELLIVDFAPDFDRRTLEELIAVERECCPFFAFSYDADARRLEARVDNPEFVVALDAIAAAFGAVEPAP
jgi:hypothetical protein